MYIKHISLRCILYLSIFLLVATLVISLHKIESVDLNKITNSTRIDINTKISLISNKTIVADSSKEDVCRTAIRLYERAVINKKNITWDEIFLSLLRLFSDQDNNLTERRSLIIKAKELCPTYNDAVKILDAERSRSTS